MQKSFYVFFRMGLPPQSAREMNVDMIEKMLRDKVSRKKIVLTISTCPPPIKLCRTSTFFMQFLFRTIKNKFKNLIRT